MISSRNLIRFFSIQKFYTSRKISFVRAKNLKHIGPGGFALLAVPIGTFCLGTWQVQRRSWKLNLIDEVTKKSHAPPVELPDNLSALSEMEYRQVKVRGRFDHSKELYIGPRQLMTGNEDGGGLMSSQPRSGNLVVTPFHLSDRDITILVNRGWVPKNKTNPEARAEGQVAGEVELIGKVRLPENRPQFSPKMTPGSNFFCFRDVPRMAAMTGAEPILLDAIAESSVPGGPIGGQTRVTFRNDHLSYLITWYSLSAATAFMWYKKYIQGMKFLV